MSRVFKWRELLADQRIPHIDRGPNVKRGELNIRCPFCGSADPSYHMGLNLDTGFWACWRNKSHRGKSPLRLIMAIMKVPYWHAREIAGLSQDFIDPEGFTAVAARILGRDGLSSHEPLPPRRYLKYPPEFDALLGRSAWRHLRYLERDRGFGSWAGDLAGRYELQMASTGDWRDRIILPYFIDHELVTWSARAIGKSAIRYKDLSIDDSVVPPKQTLYNHDAIIKGGLALVVVEGPMDTLKIDMFGKEIGVRAVGLSTNSMTDEQLYIISDAEKQFRRILFMLDNASALGIVDSMVMRQQVSHIAGPLFNHRIAKRETCLSVDRSGRPAVVAIKCPFTGYLQTPLFHKPNN